MRINDTITRLDGATFKVVAIDGQNRWVLAPLSTFGPVVALDARTIRAGFDVDDASDPRPVSEAAIIAERVRQANAVLVRAYGERYGSAERGGGSSEPHPDSPEGRFRSAADDTEE